MSAYSEYKDRVLRALDEGELVEFAKKMGEIPSQCGIEPEEDVARYIEAKLKAEGIPAELREVQPRRPNVLGFLRGSGGGPVLMFNGHTDTMPFSIDWPHGHESSIENGVLRVHGIRNMKAGVSAMVMAAVAIKRAGVPLRGDLIVAGVIAHHEGSVGTYALIDQGVVPDFAIVPEPTDLAVRTIQTGGMSLRIHVRGKSGATGGPGLYRKFSTMNDYPVDAVQKTYKVMQALEGVQWTYTPYAPLPDLPMLQVAGITGGYGPHQIAGAFVPDSCTITLRALVVPGQTVASVKADIERALAAVRHTDADLEFGVEVAGKRPDRQMRPTLQVDSQAYVARAARRCHVEVTGKEPVFGAVLPNSYFGCDAQPLWVAGCQAISYGPASHAYISANRGVVRITDMVTCAKVMALSALDICTKNRQEVGVKA